LAAASPEVHSLRSGLFRSAIGLLFPVAFDPPTGGAEMRSNKTTSPKTETPAVSKSQGVNQVTLVGRLCAAAELRETASGKHVTTIRVATQGKARTEFHSVVLWAQLADFASTYLAKGRLVYIEGRLQSRQWQAADGSTRRTVEIVAYRLQALSSKSTPAPTAA